MVKASHKLEGRHSKTESVVGSAGMACLLVATLLAPGLTVAVHNVGQFELDGNATGGDVLDWSGVFGAIAPSGVFSRLFVLDAPDVDATYAIDGGTKDINDINSWRWTPAAGLPRKTDIANTFAMAIESEAGRYVYLGADRREGGTGVATLGFWLLQERVSLGSELLPDGNYGFLGQHRPGDLLIVADFTNGGRIAKLHAYRWTGQDIGSPGVFTLALAGADCRDTTSSDSVCGVANEQVTDAVWPYQGWQMPAGKYEANAFVELGLNLGRLGSGFQSGRHGYPCYFTLVTETRSSAELNAQLKDFTIGSFATCYPDLAVSIEPGAAVVGVGQEAAWRVVAQNNGDAPATSAVVTITAPAGLPVASATLGGAACSVDDSVVSCPAGDVPPGESVEIALVTSTAFPHCGTHSVQASASTANEPSAKLADNAATGATYVYCSDVGVEKHASGETVSIGAPLSFTYVVASYGPDAAQLVWLSDTLPNLAGGWQLATDDEDCAISDAGILRCHWSSLYPQDAYTVTVVATPQASDCGSIGSTATVGAQVDTNEGNNHDLVSVTVSCPPPPPPATCPLSQGYWKTHASAWPLSSVTLGARTYTKAQALDLMNTAPKGDASLVLVHQLIAAKLNAAAGAETASIAERLTQADGLLSNSPAGSKVKSGSEVGQQMTSQASTLDDYNNGRLSGGCGS